MENFASRVDPVRVLLDRVKSKQGKRWGNYERDVDELCTAVEALLKSLTSPAQEMVS